MKEARGRPTPGWWWVGAVFLVVLLSDWAVVAAAGTDIPFHDQWDAHGQRLLPLDAAGRLPVAELWRAHGEHRILWTNALALLLFRADGQWDPLVELLAVGLLRAAVAALAFGLVSGRCSAGARAASAGTVMLAFAPLAAWHNVLWGFQSSVPFVLGFGLIALSLLTDPLSGRGRLAWGVVAALAAALAMAPGFLLAGALGPVLLLQRRETGRWAWSRVAAVAGIAALALAVRPDPGAAEPLAATTTVEFFRALGRSLAWPHTAQPWAAVLINLPLAGAIGGRLLGRR